MINLRQNINSFLNSDSEVESCRMGAKLDFAYNSAPKTIMQNSAQSISTIESRFKTNQIGNNTKLI